MPTLVLAVCPSGTRGHLRRIDGLVLARIRGVASKLTDLAREAEEATSRVRDMTARTARQTREVDALIAAGARTLNRAATILAQERERTATGMRGKVILPAAAVDEAGKAAATDDD